MFRHKKTQVTSRSDFPHGTCLRAGGRYYFVNGKSIKPIKSKQVIESWSFPIVVNVHSSAISSMAVSLPIGFRDGTLIKDINDGKMYLISKRIRRPVVSVDGLEMIGKKRSDAVWASHSDVIIHEVGEDF